MSVRPIEVETDAVPVRLGTMLLYLADPHRGHERSYNRWYERDHYYAGATIGPYQFAARRFVAPAIVKQLRQSEICAITGDWQRGPYASVYWILDGFHQLWDRWVSRQLRALTAAGRMFAECDHVHLGYYRFRASCATDPDGVPVELALDHPYDGVGFAWFKNIAADGSPDAAMELATVLPHVVSNSAIDLALIFTPVPMGESVDSTAESRREALVVCFLSDTPQQCWPRVSDRLSRACREGMQLVDAMPFVPTVVGTDRYTDELWA